MTDIISFIHWNVDPEIFQLGPFSVRWYGFLFASGFLLGYYIGEKMLKSENVSQKWIDSLFFYIIIATIVGARLGHVSFMAGIIIRRTRPKSLWFGMEVLQVTEVLWESLLH
jgi:phosphatidylglycerol---prolipoprotein diacylglyceryl transferase